MSNRVRTEFSANMSDLKQAGNAFSLLSAWSAQQKQEGWTYHGCYISIQSESNFTFNFLIVNETGLTKTQKEEVINTINRSGLKYFSFMVDPRPA